MDTVIYNHINYLIAYTILRAAKCVSYTLYTFTIYRVNLLLHMHRFCIKVDQVIQFEVSLSTCTQSQVTLHYVQAMLR